jgi:general secretion pathway protein F
MPVFSYEAVGQDGKKVKGIIDAESPRAAVQRLKLKNQIPLKITEEAFLDTKTPSAGLGARFWHRVGLRDVMVLTRQLSILIRAGLSVTGSLTAMIAQLKNPYLKGVLTNIRERLSEGSSLSEALAAYPHIFSTLYVESIAAGEESGRLSEVFQGLSEYIVRQITLRNRLLSSLAYPVIMGLVAIGVFFILMTYVLPSVSEIFKAIHQPLPPMTRLLLAVGAWMQAYGILIPIVLTIGILFFFRFKKTEKGRGLVDHFWLRVPYVGQWVRKSQIARFTRTLSTILASGIPLVKALRLTRGVITNRVLQMSFGGVVRQIGEGLPLGRAMAQLPWVPPVVIQMIAVGEESGELEEMLMKIAEMFEEETEAALKTVLSVMEPLMILFMGIIVGWIVISVLLPIFNMNQFIG